MTQNTEIITSFLISLGLFFGVYINIDVVLVILIYKQKIRSKLMWIEVCVCVCTYVSWTCLVMRRRIPHFIQKDQKV